MNTFLLVFYLWVRIKFHRIHNEGQELLYSMMLLLKNIPVFLAASYTTRLRRMECWYQRSSKQIKFTIRKHYSQLALFVC